jgi:serine phosphatase RsbU (regulator of sigma subunit)/CBS domain-containing protein
MPEHIKVKEVMITDVVTSPPETMVMDALRLMAVRRAGSIVAIRAGRPVGIFTERDLLYEVVLKNRNPRLTAIGAVMTRKIVYVDRESTIEAAYEKIQEGGFRHLLVADRGRLVGIVSTKDLLKVRERVLEKRVEEKTEEITLVRDELARSLGILNREMQYAGMFQKQLVAKKQPRFDELRFSQAYEQTSEIGGDFFEVARVDRDHAGIIVADVMGHGITSAMISIELKMNFDRMAKGNVSPSEVAGRLNDALIPLMPDSYFVAGFYCVIDLNTLNIRYTQFGLPRPTLFRSGAMKTATLGPSNMPIGFKKGAVFTEGAVRARPGDILLLFTDGCTEQKNVRRRIMGETRFINSFKNIVKEGGGKTAKRLYEEVLDFADGEPIKDDIAILLCEFVK